MKTAATRITTCPICGQARYNITTYSNGEQYAMCLMCGSYHDVVRNETGELQNDTGGGFGVDVTSSKTGCTFTRALKENERPKITEETVLATMVIDGKLVTLADNRE